MIIYKCTTPFTSVNGREFIYGQDVIYLGYFPFAPNEMSNFIKIDDLATPDYPKKIGCTETQTEDWDGNIFSPSFSKLTNARQIIVVLAIPFTALLVFACSLLYVPTYLFTGGSLTAVDKVINFPTVWQKFIGGVKLSDY